jgi:hypothetical protein
MVDKSVFQIHFWFLIMKGDSSIIILLFQTAIIGVPGGGCTSLIDAVTELYCICLMWTVHT